MDACTAALPEHILEKILVFLPTAALLRFRAVCKQWLALISTSPLLSRAPWLLLVSQNYDHSVAYDMEAQQWYKLPACTLPLRHVLRGCVQGLLVAEPMGHPSQRTCCCLGDPFTGAWTHMQGLDLVKFTQSDTNKELRLCKDMTVQVGNGFTFGISLNDEKSASFLVNIVQYSPVIASSLVSHRPPSMKASLTWMPSNLDRSVIANSSFVYEKQGKNGAKELKSTSLTFFVMPALAVNWMGRWLCTGTPQFKFFQPLQGTNSVWLVINIFSIPPLLLSETFYAKVKDF